MCIVSIMVYYLHLVAMGIVPYECKYNECIRQVKLILIVPSVQGQPMFRQVKLTGELKVRKLIFAISQLAGRAIQGIIALLTSNMDFGLRICSTEWQIPAHDESHLETC